MMTFPQRQLDVYFLLSHVRTGVPDQWVQRFHLALDLAVQRRAVPVEGLRPGSLYYETAATARAHQENGYPSGARVIVPLYTREFLHDPPPEYVELCYSGTVGGRRTYLHPVIWFANPGGRSVPGMAQARSLGAGIPDYEDVGLAAMCRLNAFARSYQKIIDRLADRIVSAAEDPDHPPHWVADGPAPDAPPRAELPFVISVLAPQWQRWNPFADTGVTLVDQVEAVARALLLPPERMSYDATDTRLHEAPGVLLVDLWALDDDRLRASAERALRRPPPWALVVLVAAARGAGHEARRDELVRAAFSLAGRTLPVISTRDSAERQIGDVVRRSRRSFLRGLPANPGPTGDPQEGTRR